MTLLRQPSVFATAIVLSLLAPDALAADRLAVIPLAGEDTTGVAEGLREALRTNPAFDVVTEAATREQIVAAADLGLSCAPDDVGCLAKIGVLGDLQKIISPVTSTGAEGVSLVLILIDVNAGAEVGRARRPITGDPNALALDALRELLDPEGFVGQLTLVIEPDGAEVLLDNEVIGTSPLPPNLKVRAGIHQLMVRHPSYPPREQTLTVAPQASTSLTIRLPPEADLPAEGALAEDAGALWTNPWIIAPAAVSATGVGVMILGLAIASGGFYAFVNCSSVAGEPELVCGPPGRFDSLFRNNAFVFGGLILGGVGLVGATGAALTSLIAASVLVATEE